MLFRFLLCHNIKEILLRRNQYQISSLWSPIHVTDLIRIWYGDAVNKDFAFAVHDASNYFLSSASRQIKNNTPAPTFFLGFLQRLTLWQHTNLHSFQSNFLLLFLLSNLLLPGFIYWVFFKNFMKDIRIRPLTISYSANVQMRQSQFLVRLSGNQDQERIRGEIKSGSK